MFLVTGIAASPHISAPFAQPAGRRLCLLELDPLRLHLHGVCGSTRDSENLGYLEDRGKCALSGIARLPSKSVITHMNHRLLPAASGIANGGREWQRRTWER